MAPPVLTYNAFLDDLRSYHERGLLADDPEYEAQLPKFIIAAERRVVTDLKLLGMVSTVTTVLNRGTYVLPKPALWRHTISVMMKVPTKVFSVVSRSSSGFIRTLVTSRAHNLVAGNAITVSNVGGNYDGSATVLSVTQKNVVYQLTSSVTEGNVSVSGGYVTNTVTGSRPLFTRSKEYCDSYWPDKTSVDYPKYYADYNQDNWLIVAPPKHPVTLEIQYYANFPFLEPANQENWLSHHLPELLRYFAISEAATFLKRHDVAGIFMGKYVELRDSYNTEEIQKVVDRSAQRKRA